MGEIVEKNRPRCFFAGWRQAASLVGPFVVVRALNSTTAGKAIHMRGRMWLRAEASAHRDTLPGEMHEILANSAANAGAASGDG